MKASMHQSKISTSVLVASLMIASPVLAATQQDTGKAPEALTARHPWIGQPAPDFHLPSTSGQSVALSAFKGQFLVIHFAASW